MKNLIKTLLISSMSLTFIYAQDSNSTVKDINATSKQEPPSSKGKITVKDINVTKTVGKGLVPVSKVDFFSTNIEVDFDGYASVIAVDTHGKRSLLLPSQTTPDTYVEKNKEITFLNKEKIMKQLPSGLHYLLVVVSQERLVLGMVTKDKKEISALEDDASLIKVLEDIQLGQYGKFVMKMVPIYTKKD